MEPLDLAQLVGAALDRLGVPRFTTGSVASTMYGEPRFTNDVDFREGGSEKHLRDIRSIIAVQGADRIEWDYLESWARRLGLEAELGGVRPRQ